MKFLLLFLFASSLCMPDVKFCFSLGNFFLFFSFFVVFVVFSFTLLLFCVGLFFCITVFCAQSSFLAAPKRQKPSNSKTRALSFLSFRFLFFFFLFVFFVFCLDTTMKHWKGNTEDSRDRPW